MKPLNKGYIAKFKDTVPDTMRMAKEYLKHHIHEKMFVFIPKLELCYTRSNAIDQRCYILNLITISKNAGFTICKFEEFFDYDFRKRVFIFFVRKDQATKEEIKTFIGQEIKRIEDKKSH